METEKIDLLKKITLSLEAGTTPDSVDLTPQSSLFEFIYGLGISGLTPFEIQLADKRVGEEIRLHLPKPARPSGLLSLKTQSHKSDSSRSKRSH
jgi:hypothetical protein